MSQADLVIDDAKSGGEYTLMLNAALAALASCFFGATPPDDPEQGQWWADSSVANVIIYRCYHGITWIAGLVVDLAAGTITTPFDNDVSGLEATTMQAAIDELAAKKAIGQPYDIPFLAAYGADMTGEDLEVRTFGVAILARDITLEGVVASIETPSVGAAVICDIEVGGASVFSTKPALAAGSNVITQAAVIQTANLHAGQRVVFKLDQVGAAIKGRKLSFTLKARTR